MANQNENLKMWKKGDKFSAGHLNQNLDILAAASPLLVSGGKAGILPGKKGSGIFLPEDAARGTLLRVQLTMLGPQPGLYLGKVRQNILQNVSDDSISLDILGDLSASENIVCVWPKDLNGSEWSLSVSDKPEVQVWLSNTDQDGAGWGVIVGYCPPAVILGKIVCKGPCPGTTPSDAHDFHDNRYWVQICEINDGGEESAISLTAVPPKGSCETDASSGGVSAGSTKPRIVVVTNLAEANDSSHFCTPGTPVAFFAAFGSDGTPHYVTPFIDDTDSGNRCDASSSSSGSSGPEESSSGPSSGSSGESGSETSGSTSVPSVPSLSGSDKSTAIVPASWSRSGYTALFVAESPEVRFDDVISVRVQRKNSRVAIDPKFLEVCAPDSVCVCGCVPDLPIAVGAAVEGSEVVLRFGRQLKSETKLTIRLTGVRKGFAGLRFPDRTREQFEKNERFIRSAY